MVTSNRKKALHKDFWMEIRKNKARFLSIFCIVALGVAFFSGIQASSPDMRDTGDAYYSETGLMDLKVVGTLGLTDEDVAAVEELKGVALAEGAYSTDVISGDESNQKVLHIESLNNEVNQLTVTEGRLPEKSGECFLDATYASGQKYKVGDVIDFTEDGDADLLKTSHYTITGIGISPLYISYNRGNTTIGSGEVNGFAYILPEDFDSEVYTQIYIRMSGTDKVISYTDAYDNLLKKVQEKLEGIEEERCQVRYDSVISEASEEISEAEKELSDGEKEAQEELFDARKKLEDGEKELKDGRREYQRGRKQLNEAKQELIDGKEQIAQAKEELADGREQLNSGREELESGRSQLNEAKETLAASRAELESGESQLNEGWSQYNFGKSELDAKESELSENKTQVLTGLETVNTTIADLNTKIPEMESQLSQIDLAAIQAGVTQAQEAVNTAQTARDAASAARDAAQSTYESAVAEGAENQEELKAQLDAANGALSEAESALAKANGALSAAQEAYASASAGKESLESGLASAKDGLAQAQAKKTELSASLEAIEAGEAELASGKQTLEETYATLSEKQAELDSGKAQLEAGEAEIAANEETLASGEAQLSASAEQIASGEAEIAANEQKILDGEKEIAENEEKLKDARDEIEDGRQELKDGLKEYQDGKEEADEKIADARQKLDDAREELNKIEKPEWIITDRTDLSDYSDYGDNAERLKSIGKVFPVIFFLVAALISLTTMTRMVEEQRTQIGTLKALGYGEMAIASKYLCYAFLATVGGSVVGILIGEKILPYIIIKAYGIMYHNVGSTMELDYELKYALTATLAAVVCTVGATVFSCVRTLSETPANLMRPPAPKEGKRILLERIPVIWKHLNFTWKSSMRNLFRYKKRLLMTIFGIAGSMGLMLVGYGIQDSVQDIVRLQYSDIQHYDGTIVADEDASESDLNELKEYLAQNDRLERYTSIQLSKITLPLEKSNLSVYLYVAEDPDNFKKDVTLRDRITHETYELDDGGAVVSEKTASLAGAGIGDFLTLEKDGEEYRIKISAVTENYAGHYVYLTPAYYKEVFGEEPSYEDIVFTIRPEYVSSEEEIGREIMEYDAVLSISYTDTIVNQVARMLGSLGIVILVLIISAGMLAFVVLYNLNNINITERQRELATLKVLGFYDLEVSQYVLRENIILTLAGIAVGSVIGFFLHKYIIVTVEVEAVMFGRSIRAVSYLYCALLTALFSIIVNVFMHHKLKKIDMVESLKSVE